jgi:hypothetical protein
MREEASIQSLAAAAPFVQWLFNEVIDVQCDVFAGEGSRVCGV